MTRTDSNGRRTAHGGKKFRRSMYNECDFLREHLFRTKGNDLCKGTGGSR
jgi:hypothetical protein